MAIENITLNIIPTGDTPSIHVAQFDVDRPFTVTLKEGADDFTPTGYTIELQVRKVDATIVTVLPEQTSGNVVTFNTTEQMTACSGTNLAELQLTKDSQTFATLHFYLVVQRDILAGGVTSESDIYNLTEQIAAIVPEVIGDDYYNKEEVDEKIAEIPTFDPTNYYDKSDVNALLNDKADVSDLPDMTNYYDKSETDALLDDKANVSDIPDMSDYYTKSEVDTKITDLYQIKTASGDIAHFIDGGDNIPVNSFECDIGATGFSQAEITVCGVNIWDENCKSGYYNVSTGDYVYNANQLCCNDFIPVKPNTNYYCYKGSYSNQGECLFYDENKTFISYIMPANFNNKVFTTPNNCHYITFNLGSSYGTTYNNDVSINYPSSDTQYHAYNGTTYTVEFGSTYNDGVLRYKNGAWYIDVSGTITSITSSTKIKTISGENNIFSNTGACEVGYFTSKSDGIAKLIKAFM